MGELYTRRDPEVKAFRMTEDLYFQESKWPSWLRCRRKWSPEKVGAVGHGNFGGVVVRLWHGGPCSMILAGEWIVLEPGREIEIWNDATFRRVFREVGPRGKGLEAHHERGRV